MSSPLATRRLGLCAVALVALAACAPQAEPTLPTHTAETDSARGIPDVATWQALATRAAYATSARTESTKFILDLEDEGRLYLLNAHLWDLHYAFVRAYINPRADHAAFNERQYRHPDRRFLLGTLVHYIDGNHFTFELVAGDTLDAERIVFLAEALKRHVYFGAELRFRPSSPSQSEIAERLGSRLATLSTDAVFADVQYQPVVVGDAYGILRLHRGPLDLTALRPNEVIVTDDVPEEISPISALITSRLQAPLAHVAVLSRNRRTPDMALRGAIDDPRVTALEGQLVHLRVTPQDFSIAPATLQQAEPSWATLRPRQPFEPVLDVTPIELSDVCTLRMNDVAFAGAKAAQLGELCSIGTDIATPGGFVVPVHYDVDHRIRNGIDVRLRALFADPTLEGDPQARSHALEAIRAAITSGPPDPRLVASIQQHLAARPNSRFIFRSSTNAEDLVGFNGAGLYESIVVPSQASEQAIADALVRVWASVWLTRAYEERAWYRIDHAQVAMAVLIQPFVDDIVGNGVAVTANPFYEGRPAVFINTQSPGGSVTGARGDEIPEQYLVYTWAAEDEPELLSRSSLTHGEPILSTTDVLTLTNQLERIHERFMPIFGPSANAVDVEFLLTRDRRFVFVQARAYRVDYGEGQTWRAPSMLPMEPEGGSH